MSKFTLPKLLLYVALIILAIIFLTPFLWMVMNSFNSRGNIFRLPPSLIPDKFGKPNMWENYKTVFSTLHMNRYTLNTFIIASLAGIGQVLTCSTAGFTFGMMKFKGKRIIFAVILMTLMIPVEVTIIPEYLLMSKLRWIDSWASLIVPSFLIGGFGTFMFKEYYESIPRDLLDASVIDGANAFQIFYRVFFPLSTGHVATLFIIAFMNNWNTLLRPLLYITSPEKQTVTTALTQFQSQYSARWELLLTGGVLSILPLILIYLFMQRFILGESLSTGTKG